MGRLDIYEGYAHTREESLGFIPNKYHPDKLRQGERKLLTSIPGLKELLVFLSGTGCEIRENYGQPYPPFHLKDWKALLISFVFSIPSILTDIAS